MQEHNVHIGTRSIWGGEEPVVLSREDRRRHLYLIGASGTGKTSLLKALIRQDIEAGEGVAVIDPHGDLAEELLDLIPPWRTDHLCYFDPSDLSHPVGLNLLAKVDRDERHLVVSGILASLKSIWAESWGPRLEYILANTLSALTECQNVSLLAVPRMLTDDRYRQWILKQVKDPAVLRFWRQEWDSWDGRYQAEATSPILNKVGALLLSPATRNVLGQVTSAFDATFLMNHRRIFIANLSKGRLGEDKSNLMGSLLVNEFQRSALRRAFMPEDSRIDFSVIVDEFQNFATGGTFASFFAELRKYHVGIVAAHQYLDQLSEEVRHAVFGNVANMISFRVGEADAQILARHFGHDLTPEHFSQMPNFETIMRISKQGNVPQPFTATTPSPTNKCHTNRENLLRRSRERYSTPRATVEDRIQRWMSKH